MSGLFRNFPLRTGMGLGLPPLREAQIAQSSLEDFRRARDAERVSSLDTQQSADASVSADATMALRK